MSLNKKIELLSNEMSKMATELENHKNKEYRRCGEELRIYANNVYYWSDYLDDNESNESNGV